ncbi:MAG TPA: sn-glycerol-3-phosphate ABC transporter substrate-binding protein UgpB [Pararhizobium sp.]|nr:sn-glycerol-3-phosphate ABC transporter substrate-binding protein UgpB [Pararhizobium sp.]
MMKGIVAGALLLATTAPSAYAATNITWWHAMGGELGQKLNQIVDEFNKSQSDYHVTAVYKGTYPETMTAAIAAFRAHKQPDIVQVYEVGTATMMAAKGAVYPVYKLMKDAGEPFNPKNYLAAVTGYYTDTDGNMLSLPFNSSTPILYYNKDEFKKAGLDPNTPPKTWKDVVDFSKKLMSSGAAKCGFSTGWQVWVQLENFSAWHNVPYGTLENGFGGLGTKFVFNGPLQKRHISDMAKWAKSGIFKYGGRESDGRPLFYSGECAMWTDSSASRASILANTKAKVGFGELPYYADVKGAPQNSIIGGASLWVLKGHSDAEYKGVAKFFTFLSSPAVQADWHEFSGYLPITEAAYKLAQKQGYYKKYPGAEISIKQMTNKPPTKNSKGIRFGNYPQVRDIINGELEQVWAGKKSASDALDESVKRGNVVLRQFQAANE